MIASVFFYFSVNKLCIVIGSKNGLEKMRRYGTFSKRRRKIMDELDREAEEEWRQAQIAGPSGISAMLNLIVEGKLLYT